MGLRKWVLASGIVILMLAVAGCVSPGESSQSPSVSPTRTVQPKPKPKPTPTPAAIRDWGFDCTYTVPAEYEWEPDEYESIQFGSLSEVWASTQTLEWCEAKVVSPGEISTDERQAVEVAGYKDGLENVDILWKLCSEMDGHYQTTGPINESQAAEARGALILCPDHPKADVMANGSKEQQERQAGLRFGTGVYEVGSRIQPGTYRASGDIENCYWARLDSAGQTIDNEFIPAATQVEVVVAASDFSLHVEGCGEFVKVG